LRLCLKGLSRGVLTAPSRVHFGLRKNPLGGSVNQGTFPGQTSAGGQAAFVLKYGR